MMRPTNFLLVDDDLDDSALFRDILQEVAPDIQLQSVTDGKEAISTLSNIGAKLPDLIFLDLNMPRMDGKECLRTLKADENLRQIPVLMYTTSSQSKDIEETLMSGAICFITKPSSTRELKQILETVVRSYPNNLEKNLRILGDEVTTFIVC